MAATQGQLVLNISITDVQDLNPYQNGFFQPTAVDAVIAQQVFADFGKRLQDIEWKVQAMGIGKDGVLSQIALSPEAILIESSKVGIVGEVTFADWLRDVNGVATGVLDPSITTIRGGVIHTGIIYNSDNSNYLDLDATGSTPFLVSASGVTIKANGQFAFGSTAGNQLTFDGTNVALGNNSLLGSTTVSTVVSGASDGTTALSTKLNKNASDVLGGNITFNSSGAFQIGTATWNGSSATGTGIMYNQYGIVAVNSGAIEFVLNGSTGSATFAGALNAATGTFAGNVSTSGSVLATGNVSSGGAQGAVVGVGTQIGVGGVTTGAGQAGVAGQSNNTGSPGVLAVSSGTSATNHGLDVIGYQTINGQIQSSVSTGTAPFTVASTTVITNLNAQLWNGAQLLGSTTGTGSVTFASNRPGGATTSPSTWAEVNVGGTIYYWPLWT